MLQSPLYYSHENTPMLQLRFKTARIVLCLTSFETHAQFYESVDHAHDYKDSEDGGSDGDHDDGYYIETKGDCCDDWHYIQL